MRTMLADTWLLMTLRWQLSWNGFRSRKLYAQVLTIIGVLVVAGTAIFISGLMGVLAGALLRQFPEQHLDTIIPGLILTAVTLLILLSSFGVALSSLFLSSDLETLMTAPVDRRAVFTSKILDGMAFYYAAVACTAVPALLTYGIGIGYGPLYYILAVLALLGTPLLPAALAAILIMLVARFAPARRVREVLGLMGALFGLGCGVLGQTSRFWLRGVSTNNTTLESVVATLRDVANIPVPSMVAGRGLSAAGSGDLGGAIVGLAGFLVITFGLFAGCVLLADNLYAAGWVRMQSSGSSKRTKQRAEQAENRRGMLSTASAASAIVLKDWRVVPRDLRNFAQMLAPLLFLPVVYLNLLGGRRSESISEVLRGKSFDPTGLLIAAGVLFSSALVFGRIADTSISREGKSWWLLKVAPVPPSEIIRGKFLAAFVPFAVLSSVLMLGAEVWKGFSIFGFVYGWYGVELLGAGMIAIETGLSVPWARLDWEDPRRMSSGWGSLLSLVTWAVLGLLGGGALCLPVLAQFFDPSLQLWGTVLGIIIATVVCIGGGLAALSFGVNRLPDVGEA